MTSKQLSSVSTTAVAILINIETSAEDVTSGVQVIEESTTHIPEFPCETLTEDPDTNTDIDTEYFTSAHMTSAVIKPTRAPATVGPDGLPIHVIIVNVDEQKQNKSVDATLLILDTLSQFPIIPAVPDQATLSLVDGEPMLASGQPDLFSSAAVTITPMLSFINGKHEVTLEPERRRIEEEVGRRPGGDQFQFEGNVTALGGSEEEMTPTVFDYSVIEIGSQQVSTSVFDKEVEGSETQPPDDDSNAEVTQPEGSVEELSVSPTTELHVSTDATEIAEGTKSTSAVPDVVISTQTPLLSISTPTSGDVEDGSPPATPSDIEGSTSDEESSVDQTSDTLTIDSATTTTTTFPLFSTEKPEHVVTTASHGTATGESPQTATTIATSLYSTEKPGQVTTASHETATPDTATATTTVSSVYSTEKTTSQETATAETVTEVTERSKSTEKPSGSPVTVHTEEDTSSSGATAEMFTKESVATTASTSESVSAFTTSRPTVTSSSILTITEENGSGDQTPDMFTKAQVSTIEFVSRYTTVHTSTGKVTEQTGASTQYTHSTSSPMDLEGSGISKTEGDQETTQPEGLGVEEVVETTSKPQDQFAVATDETEIKETESKSEALSVASSTQSAQLSQESTSTQYPLSTSTSETIESAAASLSEQGSGDFTEPSISESDATEGESSGDDTSAITTAPLHTTSSLTDSLVTKSVSTEVTNGTKVVEQTEEPTGTDGPSAGPVSSVTASVVTFTDEESSGYLTPEMFTKESTTPTSLGSEALMITSSSPINSIDQFQSTTVGTVITPTEEIDETPIDSPTAAVETLEPSVDQATGLASTSSPFVTAFTYVDMGVSGISATDDDQETSKPEGSVEEAPVETTTKPQYQFTVATDKNEIRETESTSETAGDVSSKELKQSKESTSTQSPSMSSTGKPTEASTASFTEQGSGDLTIDSIAEDEQREHESSGDDISDVSTKQPASTTAPLMSSPATTMEEYTTFSVSGDTTLETAVEVDATLSIGTTAEVPKVIFSTDQTQESEVTEKDTSSTEKPSVALMSNVTLTDDDISGDQTPDMFPKGSVYSTVEAEQMTSTTKVSSLFSTEKPKQIVTTASHETATAETARSARTTATSLYSTEKPTTAQQHTATKESEKTATTTETSLFSTEKPSHITTSVSKEIETAESEMAAASATVSSLYSTEKIAHVETTILEEESSGYLTSDMFTTQSAATPPSPVYSTVRPEQPEAPSSSEIPSVVPIIDETETSTILTSEEDTSSSGATAEMFTKESVATTASTSESVSAFTTSRSTVTSSSILTITEENGSGDQTPDMFTKAPVSTIEFVSRYTTVHTSTGKVTEQTGASTQYTHSTSSPMDLEGSGISKTEGDQETTQPEGLGVEEVVETTSKPQDQFAVATDETEIKETESKSEALSVASSTQSAQLSQESTSTQYPLSTSTSETIESAAASLSEQGSGDFTEPSISESDATEGESSGDDTSAITTAPLHTTSSLTDSLVTKSVSTEVTNGTKVVEQTEEPTGTDGPSAGPVSSVTASVVTFTDEESSGYLTPEMFTKESTTPTSLGSEALMITSSSPINSIDQFQSTTVGTVITPTEEIDETPIDSPTAAVETLEPSVDQATGLASTSSPFVTAFTYVDMGVSGISATDDDQEISKPEGSVEEAPVETTTKPQYQFTVATDKNEIRETESTSETPGDVSSKELKQSKESTSTLSPSMSSTGKPTEASTASFTEQGSGDLTIDSIAEDEQREHESSGEDISDVSTKQPASTTAPLMSSPATTMEEYTTFSVSGDTTLETAVEVDATLSIGTTAEVPKVIFSTDQTQESEVTEKDTSSTEKPSVALMSNVTLTDDDISGDQTPDMFPKGSVTATVSSVYSIVEAEQMTSTTKVSSLFSTEKPKQIVTTASHETATAETARSARTTATSLYSTEKPTTAQQHTATKESEKTATTTETSLFSTEKPSHITTSVSKEIETAESEMAAASATVSSLYSTEKIAHVETTILEEESSGYLTSDMFTTQSAATPPSPVYSTVRPEQPEAPSSSEIPSVVPIIDETETSTILTSEEDTSSSGATAEMFTKESVATTASTSESVSAFTTSRPTVTSSSILTITEENGSGDQTPDMFTKAPVSTIEFVSRYTTVHTSTGKVTEQTGASTQYTHSTSSPMDLEGSGISKTEGDQETTQPEGLGVEEVVETTSKPQDQFAVATDETEIKETESKSEALSVASSTQSAQLSQESTSTQYPLSTSTSETIESAAASLSEQGSGDFTEPSISESDATEGESSGDDTSAITTAPLHTTSSLTDSLVTKSVSTEVTNGTKVVEQAEEPTGTDGPSAGPVSSVIASVVTFTDEESSGYLTPEMFTKESTTPTSLGSEALMITSSSPINSIDQFQSTTVGTVITPTEEIDETPIDSPTAAVETLEPSVDQATGLASTASPFVTAFTYVDIGVSGISATDADQETSKPEGSVEEAPVETTTKPQYQFTVATDKNEIRETESTSETPGDVSSKELKQSQESTSTQSPSMSSTGKPTEASTASFTEQGSGDLTIDSIAEDEQREHESSGEDISDVSTKQPASTTAPLMSSPATTMEEYTTFSVSGDTTLETAVEVDATLSIGTTAEVPKVIFSTDQTQESEVTEKDTSSTEKPSVALMSNVTLTDDENSGDQTPDMFPKGFVTATVSSVYSTVEAEQMTSTTKVSSLFSTEKPKQIVTTASHETATAETARSARTTATSLYSTEKPTTAQQHTATKESEKTATTTETSLFSTEKPSHITTSVSKEIETAESEMAAASATVSSLYSTEKIAHVETTILEEDSSGYLSSDMFTTQSAATPPSPVYSTVRPEQPEAPSSSEIPSVVPIIDETETSTILTSEEDTSSSGATAEMFTKESVATTASTSESVSAFTTSRPTVTSSSIFTITEEDGSGDQTPDMFTKAPVSTIEFVSRYTTVHTSTGKVMEQTRASTQYTHSTSSPMDLEGSGISKTESDQETTQPEGLGVEEVVETTSKPQDQFAVATDETEIKETESKSEALSVASSTQSAQLSQESTSTQYPLSTSTSETIESAAASLSEQGSGDFTEPSISESDATEGESSGDDTSAITTAPLHTTSSLTDSLVTKSVSTEVTNGTKVVEQTEEPTGTDGPSAGPVSSVTASVVTYTDEESSGYLTPEMFTNESTTPTSLGSEALMITSSSPINSIDQFQSTTVGTVITPTEEIDETPIDSPTAAVETLEPSVDQATGLASTSSPFVTAFTYVDMGVSGISATDDDQETSKPEGSVEEAPVETTTKSQYQFTVATDKNEIRATESTSETPGDVSSKELKQSQESTSTQSPSMSSTGKPTEASTASFTEQGSGDLTIDSIAEDEQREHESSGEDISDVSTKQPASTTAPLMSSPATTMEEYTKFSVSGDTTLETAVEVDATLSIGTTAELPKVIFSTDQTQESEVTEKDTSSTEKPSVALMSNVTLTDDEISGDQTPDMFPKGFVTATVSSVYSTVEAEQMTSTTKH
ncbi:mucin-17-like [Salmo trutta]|uniref:mucin-17-like n=1 Tax=Salmo trutta TaxID=8032 RepID=UPI001131B711|nr:mucin-17-like [Salmo trutta]